MRQRCHAPVRGLGLHGEKEAPDAATQLEFRHALEEHRIGEKIYAGARERLDRAGLMLRRSTIVNATITNTPLSTKDVTGKGPPEMHHAKTGNEWCFGRRRCEGACRSGCRHGVCAHDNRHGGKRP